MRIRVFLAMLCGVCAALALPPFFWWPLAIVAFSGLYLLLERAESTKQSFWTGWSFGFAHHVVGLYWISDALLTDPARFGWMIPFAISLIPTALSIYIGLVAMAHRLFARAPFTSSYNIVLFAALWTAGEWLRGHLFTGFPWNLMGYVFNAYDATMQAASIVGVYGLSFALLLIATAPVLLWQRRFIFPAWCSLALPIVITTYGMHRLAQAPMQNTQTPLFIVQPNISQHHKWDEARMMDGLLLHLKLSADAPRGSIVIWPETAVPYFLHEDDNARRIITQGLGSNTLITGSLRIRRKPIQDDFDLWNSLEVMHNGEIQSFYAKSRLVPFGEYVPLRTLLPFVEKVTHGSKDFSRGQGAVTIQAKNVPPFSPLVCYEVIYPEYRPKTGQSQWLINVTNDAWFGLSSGPHQHFEMARMRAVEQGLPLVRAANTGISAIIDAYGRVVQSLPLGEQGTIRGFLPVAAAGKTFYSAYGNWAYGILILLALFVSNYFKKINKSKKMD